MKNTTKYIALVALIVSATATYAGSDKSFKTPILETKPHIEWGWETELEGESTRANTSDAGGPVWNTEASFIPWVKLGKGWEASLKLATGADAVTDPATEGKLEFRLTKTWKLTDRWAVGFRAGFGDKFYYTQTDSHTPFPYWLVEPRFACKLTDRIKLIGSYRYRNAFNNCFDYESNTAKLGFEFEINDKNSFEVKYMQKFAGDYYGPGFETSWGHTF
jgi:hypothetical protein